MQTRNDSFWHKNRAMYLVKLAHLVLRPPFTCVSTLTRSLVIGRLLEVWVFFVFITFISGQVLRAESCIYDVEAALDSMMPGEIVDVCHPATSEWRLVFIADGFRGVGDFSGTPLSLFTFREKDWQYGENSDLKVNMTQVSSHVWRVDFVLDGKVAEPKPGDMRFVWAREKFGRPNDRGRLNETDVRYFFCSVGSTTKCRTTFTVQICLDYTSGILGRKGLEPETPEFIAFGEGTSSPVEILELFGPVAGRVDHLMQRLTEYSCRKGFDRK